MTRTTGRPAGHPRGLAIVVLTGMWEVFSLFGMRSVLVFYLTQDLAFRPAAAVQIYSWSTAAALMMSLGGAVVADRVIGVRRAIILGAVGMGVGHLLLMVRSLLFPALALITAANGLFKPSLVSLMNSLYDAADPRRDRAFIIYKAGCNGAAIFAPLVTGMIGAAFGWARALALCGLGMLIACAIFLAGRHHLRNQGSEAAIDSGAAECSQRRVIAPLLLVLIGAVFFWSAHGQQGGTMALWAESSVDRFVVLLGWRFEIPAPWFQSVNPIVIVCATPIINWWWTHREARGRGSDELRKMTVGAILLAASFAVAAAGSRLSGANNVPCSWLLASLFLLTLGELYFDALGQAFLLRLAPPRATTAFVSFWFLTIAAGFAAAGWLARAWGHVPVPVYFLSIAGAAGIAALLVAVASRIKGGRGPRATALRFAMRVVRG